MSEKKYNVICLKSSNGRKSRWQQCEMANIGAERRPPVNLTHAEIARSGHSHGHAVIVEYAATEATMLIMDNLYPNGIPQEE
jgi:hypothetical protein